MSTSLSSLPPSGSTVGANVAELIIRHWQHSNQRAADAHEIAGVFATSFATVMRIVDHFKQTREARVPKPGQGKTDDPRWIFSGPRGHANLHRLERR